MTKIWGPCAWEFLHSVTFGFPIEPSEDQKNNYMIFFKTIKDILPCRYCRDSYSDFIVTEPTILDINVLESRDSLIKWFYEIHERVNIKLGVTYETTLVDVKTRFES